jgi:hypothetical protein
MSMQPCKSFLQLTVAAAPLQDRAARAENPSGIDARAHAPVPGDRQARPPSGDERRSGTTLSHGMESRTYRMKFIDPAALSGRP